MKQSRSDVIDQVRDKSARELNDTRFDRFRTRGGRRLVVGAWAIAVAALVTAGWFDEVLVVAAALLAVIGASWVLRRTVRGMADLPEEVLDERMDATRNRAFRRAFITLSAITIAVLWIYWVAADSSRIAWDIEARHIEALMWLVVGVASGLPSAIIALTEPEV